MKVDWLIVGAGFTGSVLAERLASQLHQSVLLIDSRDHVGGNAYDEMHESGILHHKYGPHIFHTSSRPVWQYLSQFTEWRPYYHRVMAQIDGQLAPLPFNLNSLRLLFPEREAQRIESLLLDHYGFGSRVPILRLREDEPLREFAAYVYESVFLKYTVKQWGCAPTDLDASVTGRVPVLVSKDDRYFQDPYQAIPRDGYTAMFRRMLRHPKIRILLNARYTDVERDIARNRTLYTGPLDELFGWSEGHLAYRSVRFKTEIVDKEWAQPVATVNYPNEFEFTRVTEQKYLTGQDARKTALVFEYPEGYTPGRNDPYYPVPQVAHRDLYQRYVDMAARELGPTFTFAGRLADYRYYNMDQAVARALRVFDGIVRPGANTGDEPGGLPR